MMFRIKVSRRACWKCLECERPGRMPGLITRCKGNVLVAAPRLQEMETAWKLEAARAGCVTQAIHVEVYHGQTASQAPD